MRREFEQFLRHPNIDQINEAINKWSDGLVILRPEHCRAEAENAAAAMMNILAANYGVHDITRDLDKLVQELIGGKIQPFVCRNREGVAVSCAALIRINETDVEIGRGACLPEARSQGGILPILLAFKTWKENLIFPETQILRGEIRTAKPTREVPGGQESQAVCFEKLGFVPTAIGPFFHHGVPDRQEMFFLASHFKNRAVIEKFQPPILPKEFFENETHRDLFCFFWKSFFSSNPKFETLISQRIEQEMDFINRFTSNLQGPLLVIKPSETSVTNSVFFQARNAFEQGTRFALARLPINENKQELLLRGLALKESGFRVIGFEPILSEDNQLRVDLLWGLLSFDGREKLVAPCFIEGPFNHQVENLLIEDFLRWRCFTFLGGGF